MVSPKIIDSPFRTIPPGGVDFHPHSFADSHGRLFRWNGELYRGIREDRAAFFSRLFRDGVIQRLIDRGLLIETEPTALKLDGYELIVRHKNVRFPSYPNEWCAGMLKDASVHMLDLQIELTRRNLSLKDAHPWNILFDGCKPVFVDLTSIVSLGESSTWPAYDEFCRFCYYPLILMCHGRERVARSLIVEYEGVLRSDLSMLPRRFALSPFAFRKVIDRIFKSVRPSKKTDAQSSILHFLDRLKRDVERINVPQSPKDLSQTSAAQQVLQRILKRLRPVSVLDIDGPGGRHAMEAARLGSSVVYFGTDPALISELYRSAQSEGLTMLPLVMDFIKPTPSIGYSSHYTVAANERIKCDMVLAFSIIEHLVFDRYLSFDLIAEGISSFSKRWAVVEFTPPEHLSESRRATDNFQRYTMGNLVNAIRKYFSGVEVINLYGGSRAFLLCSKD
ncbi:MAG TPA: hypothetical protein VF131_16765 [Blastocatellia bacterium]|nr:hypothetical protein [Blastocatellia bacterium]